jgi:hypothetical protein
VAVGTGVTLGAGVETGEALGLGEAFARRWRFFVGVAPAFSIVSPVFSIPLPTVRALAFAPFLTVSPAFFAVFSAF